MSWRRTIGVLGTVGAIGVLGAVGADGVFPLPSSTSIAPTLGVSGGDAWDGPLTALSADWGDGEAGGDEELMKGSSGRDKSGGAGLDSMAWRGAKSELLSSFGTASTGTDRDARRGIEARGDWDALGLKSWSSESRSPLLPGRGSLSMCGGRGVWKTYNASGSF